MWPLGAKLIAFAKPRPNFPSSEAALKFWRGANGMGKHFPRINLH